MCGPVEDVCVNNDDKEARCGFIQAFTNLENQWNGNESLDVMSAVQLIRRKNKKCKTTPDNTYVMPRLKAVKKNRS